MLKRLQLTLVAFLAGFMSVGAAAQKLNSAFFKEDYVRADLERSESSYFNPKSLRTIEANRVEHLAKLNLPEAQEKTNSMSVSPNIKITGPKFIPGQSKVYDGKVKLNPVSGVSYDFTSHPPKKYVETYIPQYEEVGAINADVETQPAAPVKAKPADLIAQNFVNMDTFNKANSAAEILVATIANEYMSKILAYNLTPNTPPVNPFYSEEKKSDDGVISVEVNAEKTSAEKAVEPAVATPAPVAPEMPSDNVPKVETAAPEMVSVPQVAEKSFDASKISFSPDQKDLTAEQVKGLTEYAITLKDKTNNVKITAYFSDKAKRIVAYDRLIKVREVFFKNGVSESRLLGVGVEPAEGKDNLIEISSN